MTFDLIALKFLSAKFYPSEILQALDSDFKSNEEDVNDAKLNNDKSSNLAKR